MLDLSDLTSRQARIYVFVRDTVRRKGFAPSVREIGACFGILSPNGVIGHLRALERKGYIRRDGNTARAIALLREPVQESVSLPIAGRVAAGAFQEAIEAIESLDLLSIAVNGERFAIRVDDESLVSENVRRGDFLVFDRSYRERVGDLVAARREGASNSIYRVHASENGSVRLSSLSQDREIYAVASTAILGTLVAVLRSLQNRQERAHASLESPRATR